MEQVEMSHRLDDLESAEWVRTEREDEARRQRAERACDMRPQSFAEGVNLQPEEESAFSRLIGLVMPMGRLSRRIVAILAILGSVGALLLMGTGSNRQSAPAAAASMFPDTPQSTQTEGNSQSATIGGSESATRDETLHSTQEYRYANKEPLTANSSLAQTSQEKTERSPNPATTATPVPVREPSPSPALREPGDYAVKMRAGQGNQDTSAAQVASRDAKAALVNALWSRIYDAINSVEESSTKRGPLAPGTRISMTLLEPLQSGLATSAEVQVDTDVRAGDRLLLERGAKFDLWFPGTQTNGRMSCAADPIKLPLQDGGTLVFTAAIKGADGLPGLPGKLTRTGSGTTRRVVRGLGRTAVGTASGALGRATSAYGAGYSGDLQDAVIDRYERASHDVTNVPAGVRFTLVIIRSAIE